MSEMSVTNAIELVDLHKNFKEVRAVRGMTLSIVPGEIVALLGPNGAGKTTTIDMILGRPDRAGHAARRRRDHGLVMAAISFAGGLFYPLNQAAKVLQDIAKWTPMYGLNQLVHAPLLGGSIDIMWVANAVAWFAIFVVGAVYLFRRDTARV